MMSLRPRRQFRISTFVIAALTFASMLGALYFLMDQTALAANSDTPLVANYYGACTDTDGLGVVLAGSGLDGVTQSTLLSYTVPGAVVQAWAYFNGADTGNAPEDDPNLFNPTLNDGNPLVFFNGTPVTAERRGGPAYWAPTSFSYMYRADVTSYVMTGTNDYTLSGVQYFDDYNNGWELVVLYSDPNRKPHLVAIAEGLDLAEGSSAPDAGPGIAPVVISFDPAAIARTAEVRSVAGGVYTGTQTALYYQVGFGVPPVSPGDIYGTGTLLANDPFQHSDGLFWDTFTDTVSSTITIPANATYVIFQAQSKNTNPARLEWILQTLSMEDACPIIAVTKTLTTPSQGTAGVGDPVSFSVEVENTGNTDLTVVQLTDTFDPTFLSFSSSSPDAPNSTVPAGTLTWNDITGAGVLAPGASIVETVNFTALAPTSGATLNTATAVATDTLGTQTVPVIDDAPVGIGGIDFGDAPDPTYPTLQASNGARHTIVPGIYLGTLIDGETNGQPNSLATGDDINTLDDEDGVTFGTLTAGVPTNLSAVASVSGFLNAWIDFNADGDWNDAGERILTDSAVTAGANVLPFNVPAAAATLTWTYARVRFSTQSGLGVSGAASDGEVEDYRVPLTGPNSVTLTSLAARTASAPKSLGFATLAMASLAAVWWGVRRRR